MSLVGEAAGAFTGGMDAALQEQRRQELLQSVLARFKGQTAAPRTFNFASPQGGAFTQNPIAEQPPIVPPDTRLPTTQDNSATAQQAQQALQAPIPAPPQLPLQMEMPTQAPPDAGGPGLVNRLANVMAPPSGPAGQAPGLAPQELAPPDQGALPQMDDVNEWRSAWQEAARTHQASAYTDLRRMGFDDQEVFGILGGWRELPGTVVEKLARMGQTSVPAYAEGTETPDAVREQRLSQQNAQYGARAMDPALGGKFGDPESYAQNQFQYATGGMFDPRYDRAGRGAGGSGLRVNNDPVIMRLENMAKAFVNPLTGQIFDPEGYQKINALIALRTGQQSGDPRVLEEMLQDEGLKETWGAPTAAWVRGGASSQRFVGGGGAAAAPAAGRQYTPAGAYSEELPGQGDPTPSAPPEGAPAEPTAPEAAAKPKPSGRGQNNVAPTGTPEFLRKRWSKISAEDQAKIRAAKIPNWAAVEAKYRKLWKN